MALSKSQVADIVAKTSKGENIAALATEFDVSDATIRYHMKRAGVVPEASGVTHDAEHPSDEELGIGEEGDAPATDPLASLLNNPAIAALIDQAVAARLGAMGAPVQGADGRAADLAAITKAFSHMIEVQAMQQPGYIKPLAAEVIERRTAGYVEMTSLLRGAEADGNVPEWIVGDSGFFECTNAIEFAPGMTIRTFLPPVEDFVPNNRIAHEVHAAMLQWIGGHTPGIGEQVEAAMRAANKSAPFVTGNLMRDKPQTVQLVETPVVPQKRKRVAGTVVPERHDISLAERAAGPQGPVFIGDRAA